MGLYVYALRKTAPRRPPRLRGLASAPVRWRRVGALWAAVSSLWRAPRATKPSLSTHDAVVRALWVERAAVLPLGFGVWLENERALADALRARGGDFRDALAAVKGRAQMTLRVLRTAPAAAVPAPRASGTAYLSWLRDRARVRELDPLRPALDKLTRAERVHRHDGELLLASVYHLVDRARVDPYLRAIAEAPAAPGVRLIASGPFPPYAFGPERF